MLNTNGIVRLIIEDHLKGEPQALIGLAHYLIHDKNYPIERLRLVLARRFHFSPHEIDIMLLDLELAYWH